MIPRLQPMTWLFSTTAALAFSVGVAHAQPPEEGGVPGGEADPTVGTDDAEPGAGDVDPGPGDATAPAAGTDTGAVAGATDAGAGSAGYEKGFYIKSADDKFALHLQGRVQGLFYFESDNDPAADERTTFSNFRLNRARLAFGGHAFRKNIKYKFQADFARGKVALKDFYVDYGATDNIIVRVGQYKRPFSRQQLNSSGKLELVTRSITDDAFLGSRDIGVMVHNNYEKSPDLEWAVGVFNARTADQAALAVDLVGMEIDFANNYPNRFGPAIVARVGINRGQDAKGKPLQGYAEADLEGGPLRMGVAGSVLVDVDSLDNDGASLLPGADGRNLLGEVDFVLKNNGLSASGAFYVHHQENVDGLAQFGFHVQGGYMVTDKHQAAARFAMVSADAGAADRVNSLEAAVGHSLYMFQKHNVKWQTEIRLLGRGGQDLGDEIIGYSQLQLAF